MTGWGSGYVTDIEYMPGYYKQQSPAQLAVACLMGGVACDVPDRFDDLSYIELGCGLGYGAMVLAASNPGWRVTAVDFNPAHIAAARALANEAGLANITFLEADLATLAEDPAISAIPDADVVSLHGVWSWVPQSVRDGIVRVLRAKVRPGGLVHVSYNALPGWQGVIGMQRLVREAGLRMAGRSDRQAIAGMQVLEALNDAQARHLRNSPFVQGLIEQLKRSPVEYLAHEYMNESWSPCFHADVAAAMRGAKLDWVASAQLPENFNALTLTEEQRAVADRFDDPVMRELIKDTCLERGLRHDVFVRGARRIDATARDAVLRRVVLALTVPRADFRFELEMPAGKAELGREYYGAVADALAQAPRSVAELMALPGRTGAAENPAELIAMLVGTDQAAIVARPGASVAAAAQRFNAVTARRLVTVDKIGLAGAMASARLGAGLRCPLLDLYVLDRQLAAGDAALDPAELTLALGPMLDAQEQDKLRGAIAQSIEQRAPIWRSAGAI
ncbi:class I SAM-dependent methyltransferase [Limobrevibacterium gyesilva]|uniref:Class I SAM-dependent methyltransferase n=1 Tax=Limobrevibacterium gyesilva TaxID=2991712 RepID=A0AA41YK99_9PROT|nr:class I SAM-dependent methyltransferase [Limobrevibacterium gyesilva]MCW3473891.1 class I SAM-dependent methyltransferase [Limobrevibacterium gyesilva]